MTDPIAPPETEIRPPSRGPLSRLSWVWVVPVLALAITLYVAWQSYAQRGTLIEIAFENASGIAAGKTEIKYRDVTVGQVEDISFSPDLSYVLVQARIDQDVAPYLDSDARFWVVEPEVSVRGVTGLGTVLSGVFIEGTWNSEIGEQLYSFAGLDAPPLMRPGRPGTLVILRARKGNQLAAGAPILHNGVKVGSIEAPQLSPSGKEVVVTGFVEAPYDGLLTSDTLFWDASGFEVSLGTGGLKLDVKSIASLVEGGIVFDTLVSGGDPVTSGMEFPIYGSEKAARDSLFEERPGEQLMLATLVDGPINGLEVGADVRFRGFRVGEVAGIQMIAERSGTGQTIRTRIDLALSPQGFGLSPDDGPDEALALLQDYTLRGLRARLSSGALLSGGIVVELIELPQAPTAHIDTSAAPYPLLPSDAANLSDFSATAEGVFERINALPVEDLIASAVGVLDNVNALIATDEARQIVPGLNATLGEARQVAEQFRAADTATMLNATLDETRALMSEFREAGTAAQITAALAAVETSLARIDALGLEGLVASAGEVLDGAAAVVGAEGAETLLPALTATLEESRALLAGLVAADMAATLSATLDEARLAVADVRAADAGAKLAATLEGAEAAATAVADAAEGLPALARRLDQLAARTETVVAAYGREGRLMATATDTLRNISEAADALKTLARTLQRNPNSILLGR